MGLDLFDADHGLHGVYVKVSIVRKRLVSLLLEFEDRIVGEFLPSELSVCFGPCHLSRIVLGFEVAVALGSAESEHFVVVTDESHAVSWVDWS